MVEIKNLNGRVILEVERDTLKEADLRWADLEEANFRGANLEGANLEGANFRGAKLAEANLEGADLWGADLRRSNFWGANLFGANLAEADLEGANLAEADLERADLRGANLWEVQGIFVNQINGSKDPLIFIKYGKNLEKKQLQIGCEIYPLEFWLKNYQEIGLDNEYSEKEIQEYGKYILEFELNS